MNYRHAFHAGGPADVVKHAVLARILVHLREKPAAFRVIDTHAGAGLYDLRGPEASRSLEWRDGIRGCSPFRSMKAPRALLAPYLDVVAGLNAAGELATYPGSPALVRALLRPQDRLVACELEPNAAAALARNLGRDRRDQDHRHRRLDRAQRLCAAAGAPRSRADRSAVRAAGRIRSAGASAGSGAPQMGRPGFSCSGIRSRAAQEPDALARRLRRSGDPEDAARGGRLRRARCARAPRRLRADRGQSAVDLAAELAVLLPALAQALIGRSGIASTGSAAREMTGFDASK